MNDDITLDLFVRTALALWERPEDKDLGKDELFATTRSFLQRARLRHNQYVHTDPPWYELAFAQPLLSVPKAAQRITKESSGVKALAALEKFLPPEDMLEIRKRRGINAAFCDYLHDKYQGWHKAPGREAQREAGKQNIKFLKEWKDAADLERSQGTDLQKPRPVGRNKKKSQKKA